MISLGPTSDIIVAGMLAVSQLITPVPDGAAKKAEQAVLARNSCAAFDIHKQASKNKNCEALKDNRRKYKEDCQSLENDMGVEEVQCATDRSIPKTLNFRPRRMEEYMRLSNQELVQELHIICDALQDRIFLEQDQWMNGVTANRDDLSSKLVILQKPELQNVFSAILQEASDGTFDSGVAYKVITALCHWKVNRTAVAEQIDFTGGYKYLQELIGELPRVDHLPDLPQASFVYDDRNQRIGEIYDKDFVSRHGQRYIGRVSRRRNVTPAQVPTMLMNAFISIEDRRFRQHNGFDFEGIKRLYYGGVQGGTQGGSTFTMQLVKNAFFGSDVEKERAAGGKRTLRRKLKEILMIPSVEAAYRKEEILTYYLNLISLTANAQGILMASLDLFNKDDLNDLTLSEMALLAALPKGTSAYNPWRYPEAAKLRRDLVLTAMADQGYISNADKERAQNEPIKLADATSLDQARIYSRFFTGHITNHFRYLRKRNLRDERWKQGGFDIKTAFNLELQKTVTSGVQQGLLNFERSTGRYKWKPWLDSTTNKNFNVAARIARPGSDLADVFEFLRQAHPYPETNWVVALKVPRSSQWRLENQSVGVDGSDAGIFRRLKDYDAVVLAIGERGRYRLAAPTKVQGAAVVLDIETGDVLALSGGFTAGPYGKLAENNRVTRSVRMPGSTIKPIIYLYALNHGLQPNSILRGGGVRFPKIDGCPFKWAPHNYGGGGGGSVTVRRAIEHSMNLPLVNLFVQTTGIPGGMMASGDLSQPTPQQKDQIVNTFNEVYDLAVKLGAYPDRKYLADNGLQTPCFPFLLGGIETTPLKMAQAYAAIANGGLRRDPVFLKQVFKGKTPLLVDHSQDMRDQVNQYRAAVKQGFNVVPEAFGAISGVSPQSVAQLHWLMQGVLRRGTAARLKNWAELIGGKTGTTNDSKDVWFSGYNNKIAVVVWVGYDSTKEFDSLGGATGSAVALPIFQSILEAYYKINPEGLNDPLPLPTEIPGLVHAKMDIDSGRVYPLERAPGSAVDEYLLPSVVLKTAAQSKRGRTAN